MDSLAGKHVVVTGGGHITEVEDADERGVPAGNLTEDADFTAQQDASDKTKLRLMFRKLTLAVVLTAAMTGVGFPSGVAAAAPGTVVVDDLGAEVDITAPRPEEPEETFPQVAAMPRTPGVLGSARKVIAYFAPTKS